jgi:LysR family transcriptional regulator, glycine cleavage system transcriptional activator
LHELDEGKIDLLIERSLGHHPRHRCDRLDAGPPEDRQGAGDWLIGPEGTARCPEVESLRGWLVEALRTAPALALSP